MVLVVATAFANCCKRLLLDWTLWEADATNGNSRILSINNEPPPAPNFQTAEQETKLSFVVALPRAIICTISYYECLVPECIHGKQFNSKSLVFSRIR